MRACAVWLHHQHTAEENVIDRQVPSEKTTSIVLYM